MRAARAPYLWFIGDERERESMLRTLTTMLMVLGQSCAAPCETAHVDRQAGGGRASVDPELSRSRWGSRRTKTGGTGACRGLQRRLGTAEGQVGRALVGLCTCPDAWTAGHMAARRNRQRRPVTRDVLHEDVDPHTPVRLPRLPCVLCVSRLSVRGVRRVKPTTYRVVSLGCVRWHRWERCRAAREGRFGSCNDVLESTSDCEV